MKNHRRPRERTCNRNIQEPRRECEFHTLAAQNVRLAKRSWPGRLTAAALDKLRKLTADLGLCVTLSDLIYLDGGWYVTHVGLLRLARRSGCSGIQVRAVREFCNPSQSRWVFKAIVHKSPDSKAFVGYGDADPSNVSSLVRGAEMRVAETRAVNRALRKAYGIGLCSVEELGSLSGPPTSSLRPCQPSVSRAVGAPHNGHHPRLRDQLCLLIRQHNLDPTLVKAYAADFCGTESLKEATRDLVESFISHLAKAAKEDRDGLLCKLNSYAQSQEVQQ